MSADLNAAFLTVIDEVAHSVARSMIWGGWTEKQRNWELAHDINRTLPGFIEQVKEALRAHGQDVTKVWVAPPGGDEEQARTRQEASLRYALARHIAGAYVSGSDDQVARAKELETDLDRCGLNVDKKVDSLVLEAARTRPSQRGVGGRADDVPF